MKSPRWFFAAVHVILRDDSLSCASRMVLISLAHHAKTDGVCEPSLARIKSSTRLGRTTVARLLRDLERSGRIARERRRSSTRNHLRTRYKILLAIPEVLIGGSATMALGSPTMALPSATTAHLRDQRSSLSEISSLLSISEPSLPPRVGREGGISEVVIGVVREHWPNEAPSIVRSRLATLVALGLTEREQLRYLRAAAREPSIAAGKRPFLVACYRPRVEAWLELERRARVAEPVTDSIGPAAPPPIDLLQRLRMGGRRPT